MKTEKSFKFVSIRPPQKVPKINLKDDIIGVVSDLKDKLIKTTDFKDKLALATEYQSSNAYFSNSQTWNEYEPKLNELENIIDSSQDLKNNNDLKEFKEKLVKTIGKEIKTITKNIPVLKKQVWDSFYANLISNESPEDRDRIMRWVKFIKLWEGINSQATMSEKIRIINRYNELTPIIPKDIFNTKVEEISPIDDSKENPLASRINDILTIRKEVEKLNSAKNEVEDIFTAKLKAFRHNDSKCTDEKNLGNDLLKIQDSLNVLNKSMNEYKKTTDQKIENIQLGKKIPSKGDDTISFEKNFTENVYSKTVNSSNFTRSSMLSSPPSGSSSQIPWLLNQSEIKHKNTKKVISKNKIDLDLTTSPEVVSKIENEIAKKNVQLDQLMTIERIIPKGKAFVRVKRKISEQDIIDITKNNIK